MESTHDGGPGTRPPGLQDQAAAKQSDHPEGYSHPGDGVIEVLTLDAAEVLVLEAELAGVIADRREVGTR